jgi:hypothetical protein
MAAWKQIKTKLKVTRRLTGIDGEGVNSFVTLSWPDYHFSASFLTLGGNPKTIDKGAGVW